MTNRERIIKRRMELIQRKEEAQKDYQRARGRSIAQLWNEYADAADKLTYIEDIIEQYAL